MPEKNSPDCAGFLLDFKARELAHSELCNCYRNAEIEQKDQQGGLFFNRNHPYCPDNKDSSNSDRLCRKTPSITGFSVNAKRNALRQPLFLPLIACPVAALVMV